MIEKSADGLLIIMTLFSALIAYWINDQKYNILGILISALVSFTFFHFGRYWIIKYVMIVLKIHNQEEKEMCGTWRIEINYKNQFNQEKRRIGELEMSLSPSGLTIHGDNIRDKFTDEKIIEGWTSEYVEVLRFGNETTLEYAYKIKRPNDKTHSKVGHVVVRHTTDSRYEGKFVDLLVPIINDEGDEELRTGTVILQKS